MHDIGNNETFFDRLDFQPTARRLHLDLFAARNWFQIPNTYDQPDQDQRQNVLSFNIAPGYQHTYGANTLLTVNPWVRRDFVNYYPSRDPSRTCPPPCRRTVTCSTTASAPTLVGQGQAQSEGRDRISRRACSKISPGHHRFRLQPHLRGCHGDAAGPGIVNPDGCAGPGLPPIPHAARLVPTI